MECKDPEAIRKIIDNMLLEGNMISLFDGVKTILELVRSDQDLIVFLRLEFVLLPRVPPILRRSSFPFSLMLSHPDIMV